MRSLLAMLGPSLWSSEHFLHPSPFAPMSLFHLLLFLLINLQIEDMSKGRSVSDLSDDPVEFLVLVSIAGQSDHWMTVDLLVLTFLAQIKVVTDQALESPSLEVTGVAAITDNSDVLSLHRDCHSSVHFHFSVLDLVEMS